MDKAAYLSAFKRASGKMDRATRKNIMREIESHIDELSENENIEERFGTPEELAKKYQESDQMQAARKSSIVSKILRIVAYALLVLVLILAAMAWYFSRDKFDYADESAPELNLNASGWQSVDWHITSTPIQIKNEQAVAVIYTHDSPKLTWKCDKSKAQFQANKTIDIYQNYCLIFIPKMMMNVESKQGKIIWVRPQASAKLKVYQSSLSIAKNGAKLSLHIAKEQSDIDMVGDDDGDILVEINATQSEISDYR